MEPGPITIPLTVDGGVYEVVATPEDIITTAGILQLTVEEAKPAIEGIDSEEALILINALDSRKGIKEAAPGQSGSLG